ncbi:MAG TPA: hypothetical protein VH117_11045 [Edaphobacter sp.]|jgi:hypothetical protein|nr:hypothetical protein [Edaphobacter sp.]
MTGEVRDETNLSTAEIANPTTPRSQYQSRDTSTATEVLDNEVLNHPREVEAARVLVREPTIANDKPGQLFPDNELNELRARWDKTQISFVDEPRAAVEQADSLVATVVKRIAEQFAAERAELEHQWDRGDNVSTEDLRQALRRYRSFFDRLLAF